MTIAVENRAPVSLAEPSWYRELPAGTDVHPLGVGLVAVTGHAAVRETLAHPAVLAEHPLKASARVLGPNVLDADGPRHRAFRMLLAPVLAAGRVAEYRSIIMPPLVESLAAGSPAPPPTTSTRATPTRCRTASSAGSWGSAPARPTTSTG